MKEPFTSTSTSTISAAREAVLANFHEPYLGARLGRTGGDPPEVARRAGVHVHSVRRPPRNRQKP